MSTLGCQAGSHAPLIADLDDGGLRQLGDAAGRSSTHDQDPSSVDAGEVTPAAPAPFGADSSTSDAQGDSGAIPLGQPSEAGAGSLRCGDGVRNDEAEACDGSDFGELACVALGFAAGELACDEHCGLDTSGCTGAEVCHDGADNDGDGLIDCTDADDCASACGAGCDSAIEVDPLQVAGEGAIWLSGDTRGRANEHDAACGTRDSGPEMVYQVTPTQDGVLEIELESFELLTVAVKSSCEQAHRRDDLACVLAGRSLRVSVAEGEPLFVVVDGRSRDDQGSFRLRISERERRCGDGHRDEPEACDDGNLEPGDACNEECGLLGTEQEPNDDAATASSFEAPFWGFVSGPEDRDFVAFEVNGEAQNVRILTRDLGDGACEAEMDTVLTLLDESGAMVATDDDGGAGLCSGLELSLGGGRYFVVVSALEGSGSPSFPYELDLSVGE